MGSWVKGIWELPLFVTLLLVQINFKIKIKNKAGSLEKITESLPQILY